jgi:hypothetical protein
MAPLLARSEKSRRRRTGCTRRSEARHDHFWGDAEAQPSLGKITSQPAEPMEEPIHPIQLEELRCITTAQKVRMVGALYETGIRLRVAGLRMQHPDWPPERLDFEARRSLLYAGS